jgi:predicted MFS family arabinose efflux permease
MSDLRSLAYTAVGNTPESSLAIGGKAEAALRSRIEPPLPWSLYPRRQRSIFVVVLFLVTISSNFDYYVLGMVLEPIKAEFHVSDAQLGLLTGFCFALFYALAALPFARWSDQGNRRTVLAAALLGWSLLTAFFGLAHSFWQLIVARLGVGAMEPGATPPAQSLIADYFPPQRRGSALAIMLSGGSLGYLVALALGGYIAATLGWRNAFLIAGGLGAVLALVTRLALAEPRMRLGFPSMNSRAETLRQAVTHLCRKPAFLYTLLGVSIFYFFSLGVTTFLPSYLIRTLHVSLERVSLTWGVAVTVANFLGTLTGGWLADRLGQRDIRWYAWLSGIACVLGAILYWAAFAASGLWTFVSIEFLAELVLWTGTFASWSAVHAVCGSPRRGTAIALLQFAYVLVGSGFGPLVTGVISDAVSAGRGAASLGWSLNIVTSSLIAAAIAFFWSGRSMARDRAD